MALALPGCTGNTRSMPSLTLFNCLIKENAMHQQLKSFSLITISLYYLHKELNYRLLTTQSRQ